MKSHYKKSSPPFITIARNRRGDAVFKLKKGIERDRAIFGGRFTSEFTGTNRTKIDNGLIFILLGQTALRFGMPKSRPLAGSFGTR